MTVLSLFDGMSCGVVAMMESGVEIDRYVAYEKDKYAKQTSKHNFPFIEQMGDVFKGDFTQYEGFDWLIGGSPCTYWSIAQKNNRETEASGMGWELFQQYVRALHEAKPKYFIYENNKSMSKAIRQSIDEAFGFEAVLINSALVSAQNRQRLYWVGRRNDDGTYSKVDVPQPQDRGILLKDILEDGCCVDKDKAYCLKHQAGNARDYFKKHHTQINFEPCILAYPRGKNEGGAKYEKTPTMTANSWQTNNHVTEPVRIPDYGTDKARPINALYPNNCGGFEHRIWSDNPNKQQVDMIVEPLTPFVEKKIDEIADKYGYLPETFNPYNTSEITDKAPTLTVGCNRHTSSATVMITEPVRVGCMPSPNGEIKNSQGMRVYSTEGKAVNQTAFGGGLGAKTGLYAVPVCHTIPQEVRVRKYECDIEDFQELLRSNKRMSNREIAEALGRPQTEVEHWFRTDKYFNVPDADIWFDLKTLLKIDSTEFDDYVTVFEERDGVYDKANRCYDINGKMSTVMTTANDNIIVPVNTTVDGKAVTLKSQYYKNGMANLLNDTSKGGKYSASGVAEPLNTTADGKSQTIKAQYQQTSPANILGYTSTYGASGVAEHCPCFAIPTEWDEEGRPTKARSCADGKIYTVYEVKDGKITIKGKEYPIKLPDGFYIIRKLTVRECMRLQTVPEWYEFPVSDSQAYKMLGNGWTVAVISWLIDCALR